MIHIHTHVCIYIRISGFGWAMKYPNYRVCFDIGCWCRGIQCNIIFGLDISGIRWNRARYLCYRCIPYVFWNICNFASSIAKNHSNKHLSCHKCADYVIVNKSTGWPGTDEFESKSTFLQNMHCLSKNKFTDRKPCFRRYFEAIANKNKPENHYNHYARKPLQPLRR